MFDVYAADFTGKQSPAHVFWHSLDLAMARYNGKLAPDRAGVNLVEREAYFYEVIAVGFWAGDANISAPTYYTYTAPEPGTLAQQRLRPAGATWIASGSGHIGTLPYEVVRTASDPQATLLEFVQRLRRRCARRWLEHRAACEQLRDFGRRSNEKVA